MASLEVLTISILPSLVNPIDWNAFVTSNDWNINIRWHDHQSFSWNSSSHHQCISLIFGSLHLGKKSAGYISRMSQTLLQFSAQYLIQIRRNNIRRSSPGGLAGSFLIGYDIIDLLVLVKIATQSTTELPYLFTEDGCLDSGRVSLCHSLVGCLLADRSNFGITHWYHAKAGICPSHKETGKPLFFFLFNLEWYIATIYIDCWGLHLLLQSHMFLQISATSPMERPSMECNTWAPWLTPM